jgi:HTH-type transcriptional regulator, competence development regulator
MTPFSIKLKSLRESRGVLQKSLALVLGVGPSYLSALEQGRKAPPHNADFFEKLQRCLQLSTDELNELYSLATATETLGPLAVGTSPMQLEVAMYFASRITWLQPMHVRAIQAILDMAEPPSKVSLI